MAAGHLWFVPMLLGLYIAMPLLSPWAEKASKREVSLFLVIRKFTAEGWFYNYVIRPASEASYGTYLMHMIVLAPLVEYFKGMLPTPACVVVVAVCSFIASTILSCLLRRIPVIGKFIV